MRERANRVERHVAPQLQPDLRSDVIQDPGLASRLGERSKDLLRPFRVAPVEFPDREAIPFDVANHTRLGDRSRRIGDTAQQALRVDALEEHAAGVDGLDHPVRIRPPPASGNTTRESRSAESP